MARAFAHKVSKTTIGVAAPILGAFLIAPPTFVARHDRQQGRCARRDHR